MIIVFFSSAKSEAAKRLLKDIQRTFHGHQIDMVPTVKALFERFHSPMTDRTLLILIPENRQQLEELICLGDLMNDDPVFLVLPNRNPITVSTGHRLYPRFVSYLDADFSHVTAVLAKMIENVEDEKRLQERRV